jgi:hypothetical protein
MDMPTNCPLTAEQFASLPPTLQASTTAVWIKDSKNPDLATLDQIVAVCNRAVLPVLARHYFAQSILTQQHIDPTTFTSPVRERAANGQ